MTHDKNGRAKTKGHNWVTHLDGRRLPHSLLTPIPPVDYSRNALLYRSNIEPNMEWVSHHEQLKLSMLVEHAGWTDNFAKRPDRYAATYLLIIDEQNRGFPFPTVWKALSTTEDFADFKDALLDWARDHLVGFTVGWPSGKRVGRPALTWRQDLQRLVDLFNIAPGKRLSIKERCRREASRQLAAYRRRSLGDHAPKASKPTGARSLENAFHKLTKAQLESWLVKTRNEDDRAPILWALGEKRTSKKSIT